MDLAQTMERVRLVAAPFLDDCSDDLVRLIVESARPVVEQPRPLPEFNPLGGASRGVGFCTCPCGKGTDPGCRVHP